MKESGRVVVVSGGSRGLGEAIVKSLLGVGDVVATFSRSPSPFVERQRAADPDSSRFVWEPIDAEDHEAVRSFVLDVQRRFGRIDALVNNAAVVGDGVLSLMRMEDVHRMLSVNLESAILLAQACSRAMLQGQGGTIVNVSSILGINGARGLAVYGATKAGLDAFTRGLARELGPRNIRVNSIAPGYMATEMTASMSDRRREQILRRTPLGRLASMEDIVAAVEFLLSPAAAFVTGHTLVVDGGLTC